MVGPTLGGVWGGALPPTHPHTHSHMFDIALEVCSCPTPSTSVLSGRLTLGGGWGGGVRGNSEWVVGLETPLSTPPGGRPILGGLGYGSWRLWRRKILFFGPFPSVGHFWVGGWVGGWAGLTPPPPVGVGHFWVGGSARNPGWVGVPINPPVVNNGPDPIIATM